MKAASLLLLLALSLAPLATGAQQVSLHGTFGKKALLVIDGGAPQTLTAGQTVAGVKLLSAAGDEALVSVGGEQRRLRVGEAQVSLGADSRASGERVSIRANADGHFFVAGSINNRPVQFMVDTGASLVSISRPEAERLGLKYHDGRTIRVQTANGDTDGWVVKVDQLRIGDVVTYAVDAVVTPVEMPVALLGNSFLNRFSMQRNGPQMMLIKR